MSRYSYDSEGRFIIDSYNEAKPFSSFLPGVAGIDGKPMWVFYVNRGQAIASFGVRDKNGSIMEFYPANKSYQFIPTHGFRTFIKLKSEETAPTLYEPFSCGPQANPAREKMFISAGKVELESVNDTLGLTVYVTYYTLPHDAFAGLVRHVSVTNSGNRDKSFEVIDGAPVILPHGIDNGAYKELGNTLKAWMDVYNLDRGVAYYKVRASTADTAEVSEVTEGHFMGSFAVEHGAEHILTPIVDAELVFAQNTSLNAPSGFIVSPLADIAAKTQVTANKVPCGFVGTDSTLAPGETLEIYSIFGHASSVESVNSRAASLLTREYMEAKEREADALLRGLTDIVETHSGSAVFDEYARQCYLDNMIRGGLPVQLVGEKSRFTYHVYSRKHGDLERDYNFFSLQPSYYSQGNGNFRDANQNRRSDVLLDPEVADFNIRMFMSFIQADGYNPLVVKGCSFTVRQADALLEFVEPSDRPSVARLLSSPYTPGELLAFLEDRSVALSIPAQDFLHKVLDESDQNFEADFGEGYWSDHWTYNLDLVETYLAVYPDRLEALLFGDGSYAFYDSPAIVRPRSEKYVLTGGKVRQYNAIEESKAKEALLHSRPALRNWVRTGHGKGDVYRTNLHAKLVHLALMKFTTLDVEGLGIEMEANKPGWNDSLNGLPGILASGFGETCELLRIVKFLRQHASLVPELMKLPQEVADLLRAVVALLDEREASTDADRDFRYWDAVSAAREEYRVQVAMGFDGAEAEVSACELESALGKMDAKMADAMDRGLEIGGGIYPTFLYYSATGYEPIVDESGKPRTNGRGLQLVRVTGLKRLDLPHFLEGPARAMKVVDDTEALRMLYANIRKSSLYDQKLKMYRTNESLAGATMEVGRSRAFTPGWLENESIFLHMEYKYLLALLKGGLYAEFFEDMKSALVPFLSPDVYGRSTLENSSFIASSANPDPSLHGTGFVARLSGSTAEFLSMWCIMMAGEAPFVVECGELSLRLAPVLPGWLFDAEGCISFRFLGSTTVTYHNPQRKNTFGAESAGIDRVVVTTNAGECVEFEGAVVPEPYASMVRAKGVRRIEAHMS